jgi:ABC-type uncharacterized transport system substrate-binding protein
MNLLKSAAAAFAGLTLLSASALAHPHVIIEGWSDVIFNGAGLIEGIYIEWAFDENYSEIAIEGLDANDDGFYSAAELDVLTRENIAALKDYNYFVYAKADGKQLAYGDVTEYTQILTGKILKLHFRVPLAEPVDPRKAEFTYKIYDPSFYIAIDYAAKSPVNVIGTLPEQCKVELGKVVADEQTEQTREMLSTKGQDWQPEEEEDFGALFAQPVNVICKPKTT